LPGHSKIRQFYDPRRVDETVPTSDVPVDILQLLQVGETSGVKVIKIFSSPPTHRRNELERLSLASHLSGMYYKHIMIVNDDLRIVNKCQAAFTDYGIVKRKARVVINDQHMFITQATALFGVVLTKASYDYHLCRGA
jgi:hypothetical protein